MSRDADQPSDARQSSDELGEGFLLTSPGAPAEWRFKAHHASRPRGAEELLTQSEVTPVAIDRLRNSDLPPRFECELRLEIPVLVVDTFDAVYAFERVMNKLHGFSRNAKQAKWELSSKLLGHLKFLTRLESDKMAERLKLELEFLRAAFQPAGGGDNEGEGEEQ